MNPKLRFRMIRSEMVACALVGLALAQGPLFGDGVTRLVEPLPGGCKVTLAWDFTGKVESDLVIEERFPADWSVDDATVLLDSLDAKWSADGVARFAVKPSALGERGAISFAVVARGGSAEPGKVSGDWKMYLDGKLREGTVDGRDGLSALAGTYVPLNSSSAMAHASKVGEATPPPARELLMLFDGPGTAVFTGTSTYDGWLRDANGVIAGLLSVKAGNPAKKEQGELSKLTVNWTPFGGKKQSLKGLYALAGGNPEVEIPGVGTVTFWGDRITGLDGAVQMAVDGTKSKDKAEKNAAKTAVAKMGGVWTLAFGTPKGYASFSVAVKNGKGKLQGFLPDGTKINVSTKGVLGEERSRMAFPFTYAKNDVELGLVFWVDDAGACVVSDLSVAAAELVSGKVEALEDGERVFRSELFEQAFTVAGQKKWVAPKDNPNALKLSFAPKTGLVKGSFTFSDGSDGKGVKYTVNGVVVDGRFYGSASVKKLGQSIGVTAD